MTFVLLTRPNVNGEENSKSLSHSDRFLHLSLSPSDAKDATNPAASVFSHLDTHLNGGLSLVLSPYHHSTL